MKLIMENWKKFLQEDEVQEVAQGMGPGGLSELGDITFKIKDDGYYYNIYIIDGSEEIGDFQLDREGPCGTYTTHAYTENEVKGKIGPFVYDMLIELGTLLGVRVASSSDPSGLHDRIGSNQSGTRAIEVWEYYYKNRHDLDKKQLECTARKFQYDRKYVYPPWAQGRHALKNPPPEIELRSMAINHSYTKPPIFLKQLKASGKLTGPDEIMKLIPGDS
jgi:hypothetical protein